MRRISYSSAIREGVGQLLAGDDRVFVLGRRSPRAGRAGRGAALDLDPGGDRDRRIDSPGTDDAVAAAAVGAAASGMRPILVDPGRDALASAFEALLHPTAGWPTVRRGGPRVGLVIFATLGRGDLLRGESVSDLAASLPGLKVVAPSTPADAKGLLIAAVRDGGPVLYLDDPRLHGEVGAVSALPYETPIGPATIRRAGGDVTVVATSATVDCAIAAADRLAREGFSCEVVDVRTVRPWDRRTVLTSVARTGRLIVVEEPTPGLGLAAEVAATVAEVASDRLAAPVRHVGPPARFTRVRPRPTPDASPLTELLVAAVRDVMSRGGDHRRALGPEAIPVRRAA